MQKRGFQRSLKSHEYIKHSRIAVSTAVARAAQRGPTRIKRAFFNTRSVAMGDSVVIFDEAVPSTCNPVYVCGYYL